MKSLKNPYVSFYDAFSAGYYRKVGGFLKRNVRFSDKRVLCLASGTGYFPEFYLRNGARHVTSVDISPDFLWRARERLKGHPRRRDVVFIRADMAKFETRKRYDLVLINGNSFCYLQTQEEQLACLERIKKHLEPGGRAYIGIIPLSRRMNADYKSKRSCRTETGERIEEKCFAMADYTRHRIDFNFTWKTEGREYRDVVRTRIMTVPEFSLLVRLAGLRIGRVWADGRRRIPANPYNRIYELKK